MLTHIFFLLGAAVALSEAAKLPKHWKTCKRNDPNINQCLKKVILEDVYDDLMKGTPSLGMPPLAPLHFIKIDMASNSGPVAVDLTFKDIDIVGLDKGTIDDLDFHWDKGYIHAKVSSKQNIAIIGNYDVTGKVLLLPIVGKGKCNFTIVNPKLDYVEEGSFVTRKGKEYYHGDKAKIDLNVDRVYMRLDNLFNGDKALGENMNKVLNENWEEVFVGFKAPLMEAFAQALKEVSNRLFDKVSFDQIAPLN